MSAVADNIFRINGELAALQALLLALASRNGDLQWFRVEGAMHIQRARDAYLATNAPDTLFAGIDAVDSWLKTAT
jgi:hypothetical protein